VVLGVHPKAGTSGGKFTCVGAFPSHGSEVWGPCCAELVQDAPDANFLTLDLVSLLTVHGLPFALSVEVFLLLHGA
jgi:hypothetical protein